MTNINPQYAFDNTGNPVGVFLPIDDWNAISEELNFELPQWQKDVIDDRLSSYQNNLKETLEWDSVLTQFESKM